jgi:hypothetical protein
MNSLMPLSPIELKFTVGSTPSTRITRRQFPHSPAYAFTDFKSQGQTIEHVSVDIGKTTFFKLSPFNAYVALSRSRSRKTIRLLRDFDALLKTFAQKIDESMQSSKKPRSGTTTVNMVQLHHPICLFHHVC